MACHWHRLMLIVAGSFGCPAAPVPIDDAPVATSSTETTAATTATSSSTGPSPTGSRGSDEADGMSTGVDTDTTSMAVDSDSTTAAPDESTDSTTGGAALDWCGDPTNAGPHFECNPLTQDCPDGERCVGTAEGTDFGTRCEPLSDDPQPVDAPCDGQVSQCDVGLFCSGGKDNATCQPMCTCAPDPACPETLVCAILGGGAFPLCLPVCDPLLQDCADGQGCFPTGGSFVCIAHGPASYPEACEAANGCLPGELCVGGALPDCAGAACCTPYCELGDPGCPEGLQCMSLEVPRHPELGICTPR